MLIMKAMQVMWWQLPILHGRLLPIESLMFNILTHEPPLPLFIRSDWIMHSSPAKCSHGASYLAEGGFSLHCSSGAHNSLSTRCRLTKAWSWSVLVDCRVRIHRVIHAWSDSVNCCLGILHRALDAWSWIHVNFRLSIRKLIHAWSCSWTVDCRSRTHIAIHAWNWNIQVDYDRFSSDRGMNARRSWVVDCSRSGIPYRPPRGRMLLSRSPQLLFGRPLETPAVLVTNSLELQGPRVYVFMTLEEEKEEFIPIRNPSGN